MVTPVTAEGRVDEAALDHLVDPLLAGGVDGILSWAQPARARPFPASIGCGSCNKPSPAPMAGPRSSPASATRTPEEIVAGNEYLRAGVDAVVIASAGGDSGSRFVSLV